MYGHVGYFTATEGNTAELLDILIQASREVPGIDGLIQYQIFSGEDGRIWAVEIWDSKEAHDASLHLQITKDLIAKARPIIADGNSNHLTFQGGLGPDGRWIGADGQADSQEAGNA